MTIKTLNLNGSTNALTIDVEDWFQVANLRNVITFEQWDKCESRILPNIEKLLLILSNFNVKATFFVLGWIAEKHPEIVKLIQEEEHEIATHGYSHKSVYELTPGDFRHDIETSIEIIEMISGSKIIGYRAPNYSITPDTTWAWEIVAQLGLKYDSSIFPVKHNRYGFHSAPRFPFILKLKKHGKLIEFPLSTLRLMGNNIPVAGGAYLRLYPYWFIRAAIKKINLQAKPAIIYLHPWELDAHQPRMKIDFMSKFKHYGNLQLTEHKLRYLLEDFKFMPIKEMLGL